MVYVDTIVEGRIPVRKVFPLSRVRDELKRWVGITNVYRSIYTFSMIDPMGRPDWNTANLDVIYLDVDVLDSRGKLHDEDAMEKITKWLDQTGYRRHYLFTGGGFGVVINVSDAKKERIYNAHYYLRADLDFNIDKAAIDLARGHRFVPSYNFSKGAYVSYISEQEAGLPFREIHSRYQTPGSIQTNPIYYGEEIWSLKNVSSSGKHFTMNDPGPINSIRSEKEIADVERCHGKVCDTILRLARQDHVSHQERFFIILYIKDVLCVPYAMFADVFNAIMGNKEDMNHSINDEQQGRYAYARHTKFNPRIFKMYGECPEDCICCQRQIEENRELMESILL